MRAREPWRWPCHGAGWGGMLAALGPLLAGGLTLYCLDGGNLFDCLPLAAWLRSRRADVQQIFSERIFLSRAFTCHQLAGAVDELLRPLATEARRRPARRAHPGRGGDVPG